MPVCLEPNQQFSIVLSCDKDKPKESRPTFFAMSQPIRGQRRISKVLDRLTSDEDVSSDELFDDILEELGRVLVGWKNMNGLEYSKEALEDTLTFTEARELVRLVGYNAHITTEEKKSSE